MTAFALQWQSWVVVTETISPAKPKIFIILSFPEKVWWPLLIAINFTSTHISWRMEVGWEKLCSLGSCRIPGRMSLHPFRMPTWIYQRRKRAHGENCTTTLECITSAYFLLANTSHATLINIKMVGECNLRALDGKNQKQQQHILK